MIHQDSTSRLDRLGRNVRSLIPLTISRPHFQPSLHYSTSVCSYVQIHCHQLSIDQHIYEGRGPHSVMCLLSSGLRLHCSTERVYTRSRALHIDDLLAEGLVTFNVACLSNVIVLSGRAVMYHPTHNLSRSDIADLWIKVANEV